MPQSFADFVDQKTGKKKDGGTSQSFEQFVRAKQVGAGVPWYDNFLGLLRPLLAGAQSGAASGTKTLLKAADFISDKLGIPKSNAARMIARDLETYAEANRQRGVGGIPGQIAEGVGKAAFDMPLIATLGPAKTALAVHGAVTGLAEGGVPGALTGAATGALTGGALHGISGMRLPGRIGAGAAFGAATTPGGIRERVAGAATMGGLGAVGGKEQQGVVDLRGGGAGKQPVSKIRTGIDLSKPKINLGKSTEEVAVDELRSAVSGAKKILPEQKRLTAKSRGEKMASFLERKKAEGLTGEEAFKARRAAQYGKTEKADFSSIREKVSDRSRKIIHDMVEESPLLSEFDKISAGEAIENLLSKDEMVVPQKAQLELLHKSIGPALTKALVEKAGIKTDHKFVVAGNVLRTAKASVDLSMGFRQAVLVAARHPKIFFDTVFKKQVKYFLNESNANEAMDYIRSHPKYALASDRLAITEMDLFLKNREEAMMGAEPLEKIPVYGKLIRASNRAYTVGLNTIRFRVFDKLTDKWQKLGFDIYDQHNPKIQKLLDDTASLVNSATGRGSMGRTFNEASAIMNTALFSPRLQKARIDMMNPLFYKKMSTVKSPITGKEINPVRKEAIGTSLSFLGAGLSTLILLKLSLGDKVDIETNPTSSDFLKVKVGKTRVDIWGGFQQYVVLLSRIILGKTKSANTGRISSLGEGYRPDTRAGVAVRFGRSKLAPLPGTMWDILEGRRISGEEITIPNTVLESITPMLTQDVWDILQEDPTLLPIGLAGVFGVGITTHRNEYGKKKKGESFSDFLKRK